MAIRYLIAAAMMFATGAASADVIPSTSGQSGFLSNWTTGNGTDVLTSGVLASNVSLIGGISHSAASNSNVNLADVLRGKAAATLGQGGGEIKLSFTKGIEAMYVLGAGNGILAAMAGDGMSVVGSSDGVTVTPGVNSGVNAGGGASGGGAAQAPAPAPAPGGSGGGGNTVPDAGGGQAEAPGATGPGSNDQSREPVSAPPLMDNALADVVPTAVPEPSTVALMLAGMFGAGALKRRRPQ
jgi:hypothetical protein